MKIKKLAKGLELRHSTDGFTLSFTPEDSKSGALLNMSNIANERGNITKAIMLRTMGDVISDESPVVDVEKTIDSLRKIKKHNDNMQMIHAVGSPAWHNHESIGDLIFNLLTELGD